MKLFSALAVPFLFAAPAVAQVATVGPFQGTDFEGFEMQPVQSFEKCVIGRAFHSKAELCSLVGENVMITSGWNFVCLMSPKEGASFVGSTFGPLAFRFDQPIRRFGGYFGTNGVAGSVTVRFYDDTYTLVDTVQANVPNGCVWTWNGWETQATGIIAVEIENSQHNGGYVLLDALECDAMNPVGTFYCTSSANSTGVPARISAIGSTSVSASDLKLQAIGLPPGKLGTFFYGPDQVQTPLGNGTLCVGTPPALGRLNPGVADMTGVIQRQVHYQNPPSSILTITAGSTWNFQAWFEDPAGQGAQFDTTDAIQLVFVP